jgi:hypothetical protein
MFKGVAVQANLPSGGGALTDSLQARSVVPSLVVLRRRHDGACLLQLRLPRARFSVGMRIIP